MVKRIEVSEAHFSERFEREKGKTPGASPKRGERRPPFTGGAEIAFYVCVTGHRVAYMKSNACATHELRLA